MKISLRVGRALFSKMDEFQILDGTLLSVQENILLGLWHSSLDANDMVFCCTKHNLSLRRDKNSPTNFSKRERYRKAIVELKELIKRNLDKTTREPRTIVWSRGMAKEHQSVLRLGCNCLHA